MLKKTITYEDFFGEERTETLYFNLSKAELIDLEVKTDGDFSKRMMEVGQSKDPKRILGEFKELLRVSYGVRSEDGQRFIKNDEVWEFFLQTAAFDYIYNKMCTDADFAADFLEAIMPQDIMQQYREETRQEDLQDRMAAKLGTIPKEEVVRESGLVSGLNDVTHARSNDDEAEYQAWLQAKREREAN